MTFAKGKQLETKEEGSKRTEAQGNRRVRRDLWRRCEPTQEKRKFCRAPFPPSLLALGHRRRPCRCLFELREAGRQGHVLLHERACKFSFWTFTSAICRFVPSTA